MARSLNRFERERYSLSATNAQGDYAAFDAIALHRMQKARCEHRPGRTNRMTMCNGTTLNIDNVLRQTEVLGDRDGNGCECLIDFDALDICGFPSSAFERLLDCRNWT